VQITAIPDVSEVLPPEGVHLERADNPGPLSLAGTNTWILAGRTPDSTVVIDPGPPQGAHLEAIRSHGRPAAVILTHQHIDHSEAAPALSAEFGIPVYSALPELAVDTTPLTDGDVVDEAGWQLAVLGTPGHTIDSVCLQIEGALFTGDTLLGGSTTIIAPPSGSLADYFATMKRLGTLRETPGFPGHGPAFSSVGAWATHNAQYREERLAQLVEVYAELSRSGVPTLGAVATATYGENGEPVADYVEAMTEAQLRFLSERGDISGWG
jgi:glyoxylase-like metal-dependent hydrolase (beta-lactamase superfamily II)